MIRLAGAYLQKMPKGDCSIYWDCNYFFIVFFLSSVPVDTVQYAAFLSVVLMCIVGIIDFCRFLCVDLESFTIFQCSNKWNLAVFQKRRNPSRPVSGAADPPGSIQKRVGVRSRN
mgnify:CR=1 FL=1